MVLPNRQNSVAVLNTALCQDGNEIDFLCSWMLGTALAL